MKVSTLTALTAFAVCAAATPTSQTISDAQCCAAVGNKDDITMVLTDTLTVVSDIFTLVSDIVTLASDASMLVAVDCAAATSSACTSGTMVTGCTNSTAEGYVLYGCSLVD
ncbi:hypothetical protein CERSUDRAFT_119727 [Gelatoporia subvermispora B]|uniref:Hydrophobin n=1 Tax=Ceriporiopsis subvermispora (strain B) TaxID=914234 RepID=M2Q3Z8_CERS8|nr:hypothetical protein CERSUDRAFT_119727 [Gelatoporia subvermispora B]